MSDLEPEVSIVIPTHDRVEFVVQCLGALARQDVEPARFEVIVVADGCTDGTPSRLREPSWPFELRVLEQPARGAAAARNLGAASARSRLLLFLDDDVIASTRLVHAHILAHAGGTPMAAVGPYLIQRRSDASYIIDRVAGFWEDTFGRMSADDWQPSYQDFVSGNLSIPAELFRKVGGFDAGFARCSVEDYELGARLLEAGVRLRFLPNATAVHLETMDLRRSLVRAYRVGGGDLMLARLHPQIAGQLPFRRVDAVTRTLVFTLPKLGATLAAAVERTLPVLERLDLESRWNRAYRRLKKYWYWRGVADEGVTLPELQRFVAEIDAAAAARRSGQVPTGVQGS